MHIRPAVRGLSVFAALLLAGGTAACGGSAPGEPDPASTDSFPPDPTDSARASLAAHAALAQDHRFAALYHFDTGAGSPQRNVVATVAPDGSWRVDIAGGALGGAADVSIVSNAQGVYQCSLPSVSNPVSSTCVRVANPGKAVPKAYDPKVERLFRQWLPVFTDRQSALSVSIGAPLPGAQGTCYSIDSISASLSAPVDVGIYCYTESGLLTAARVGFGELSIASTPVTPPAKVDLPGPITPGPPLSTSAAAPDPTLAPPPSAEVPVAPSA